MIKVELRKRTVVYGDLKAGDVFSWPVDEQLEKCAISLKLRDGFVWIRSAGGCRNMFSVDINSYCRAVRDLQSNLPVKHEGTLSLEIS